MGSFLNDYSEYYDLLYTDKDYKGEAKYVDGLITTEGEANGKLLEIGSGTGNYGAVLSSLGYQITAIEKSASMSSIAREKKIANYDIIVSDILDIDLKENAFAAVLGMFHVICYLTSAESIQLCFDKIYSKLMPGGVFIFDTWHTPAVLYQKPEIRSKTVENSNISLTRTAIPTCHDEQSLVEVDYKIRGVKKQSAEQFEFSEKHVLRHFSINEIVAFAEQAGFKHIRSEEFMTGNAPTENTWGVCHILKKL